MLKLPIPLSHLIDTLDKNHFETIRKLKMLISPPLITVLSILVIGMMGLLASIISWVICIFAIVASVAVSTVLWLTYYDISNKSDATIKYSYLEEFVRNETAIYALAIIATVIMVFIEELIIYLFIVPSHFLFKCSS